MNPLPQFLVLVWDIDYTPRAQFLTTKTHFHSHSTTSEHVAEIAGRETGSYLRLAVLGV
jgi:hypothetical protein